MDEDDIFPALLVLELPDGLQERLALNVAHCAADFDNGNFRIFCHRVPVETAFDLVCDVGDHLHGASAEIAPPFFLQYGPVNFSGSHIGVLCKALIDKALIVTQIQVCLRPVVCDEDFSMLHRIHGARVNVDIRIKLLHGHCISSGFQKPSKGCRRDTFSQS